MMGNTVYKVQPVERPICETVKVPGSKSITNRALLLASLATGKSYLTNVLFSDDTRNFMHCLQSLGYEITTDENKLTVTIMGGSPKTDCMIDVGGAGTAARFLTALLAAHPGMYTIQASTQMKSRPMKPLFDALIELGAKIDYIERDGYLPIRLYGKTLDGGYVVLDASYSSQFISALLMIGGLFQNGLYLQPSGKKVAQSYIQITTSMIKQFGGAIKCSDGGGYTVNRGQKFVGRNYQIEPDISGACYFFAMAALTGGSVLLDGVHFSTIQGDIKFLHVLKRLGCSISQTEKGILVQGPQGGVFPGVDIDLNDYSDQTMTLAALAPFATSPTTIRNIGHIRHQESDRIRAIVNELTRIKIHCEEKDDSIIIYPGTPEPAIIQTYNDHRMAMAFSLVGLRTQGISIADPSCVSKTFPNFLMLLSNIINNTNAKS